MPIRPVYQPMNAMNLAGPPAPVPVVKGGSKPGHAFRGNQYTGGISTGSGAGSFEDDEDLAHGMTAEEKEFMDASGKGDERRANTAAYQGRKTISGKLWPPDSTEQSPPGAGISLGGGRSDGEGVSSNSEEETGQDYSPPRRRMKKEAMISDPYAILKADLAATDLGLHVMCARADAIGAPTHHLTAAHDLLLAKAREAGITLNHPDEETIASAVRKTQAKERSRDEAGAPAMGPRNATQHGDFDEDDEDEDAKGDPTPVTVAKPGPDSGGKGNPNLSPSTGTRGGPPAGPGLPPVKKSQILDPTTITASGVDWKITTTPDNARTYWWPVTKNTGSSTTTTGSATTNVTFNFSDDGGFNWESRAVTKSDYSAEERNSHAEAGVALPDGSFPIANEADLHNAIRLVGQAANPKAAMAHILERAQAMGLTYALPKSWQGATMDAAMQQAQSQATEFPGAHGMAPEPPKPPKMPGIGGGGQGGSAVAKEATPNATDLDPEFASAVLKADSSRRYTLAPVYMPNTADAHGEWATADDLQSATWDYVRKTSSAAPGSGQSDRAVYLQHSDTPAGEWVEIMAVPWPVEATLTVPGAVTKSGTDVVTKAKFPAGTVYMGVIWEPWAWTEVKKGHLTGYSMGGKARRVEADIPASASTAPALDFAKTSGHESTRATGAAGSGPGPVYGGGRRKPGCTDCGGYHWRDEDCVNSTDGDD